jgi:hypothetical protein
LRKYGREKRYTFFQLYRLRGKRAYWYIPHGKIVVLVDAFMRF